MLTALYCIVLYKQTRLKERASRLEDAEKVRILVLYKNNRSTCYFILQEYKISAMLYIFFCTFS